MLCKMVWHATLYSLMEYLKEMVNKIDSFIDEACNYRSTFPFGGGELAEWINESSKYLINDRYFKNQNLDFTLQYITEEIPKNQFTEINQNL